MSDKEEKPTNVLTGYKRPFLTDPQFLADLMMANRANGKKNFTLAKDWARRNEKKTHD